MYFLWYIDKVFFEAQNVAERTRRNVVEIRELIGKIQTERHMSGGYGRTLCLACLHFTWWVER